jgi:hypothetical protein
VCKCIERMINMAWQNLLFDGSDDDGQLDEELNVLLEKIDKINDSDEDGIQKELIELCDSALELVKVSQPDNDDLLEILYWSTGYAYLELAAEDDTLLEKSLKYLNEIPDNSPQWHIAMARISFYKENFREALHQIALCKKMIVKNEKDDSWDPELGKVLREMCQCGLIRIYYAIGDEERFKNSFSRYIKIIKNTDEIYEFSFIQVVDLLVSVSKNTKNLKTLLQFITPETVLLEVIGTQYLLKSQISYLEGKIEESNEYAYHYKMQIMALADEDDASDSIWTEELAQELHPNFNPMGFICMPLARVETTMALTEERSKQHLYSTSDDIGPQ